MTSIVCEVCTTLTVTVLLTVSASPNPSRSSCVTTSGQGWSMSTPTKEAPPSVADVFLWVCEHPGSDAEHVGNHFGVSYGEADEILETLLNKGLLDFAQ